MSDTKKITLEWLKNEYKQGLLIPEIQREYVMGAGGKLSNGEDKLKKLLDTILIACKEHKDFDFSCIITYENTDKRKLEIYDGQQRITTLFIMIIFKLYEEDKSNEVESYKEWYSFLGRTSANDIINKLTNKSVGHKEITEDDVVDFTSFSMINLWKSLKEDKYKSITSEFLLNQVKFDMVSIGSQSEIEQFFMDLNSGIKLKDYELYKAKLVHHISTFNSDYYNKSIKEAFQQWPHKMDNEWLDFFSIFADFNHIAEEYEIEFIKYCIRMICFTEKIEYDENKFDCVNEHIILKVYELMELVSRLNFSYLGEEKNIIENVLKFSWGGLEERQEVKKCNYDKRGAFWNLEYEAYDKLLYYVIKEHLIKKEKGNELDNDVVLWCFITTLNWNIDVQKEYLRLVKIILNRNVEENTEAWYECQLKGQYLYYCKYSAYGIPQYYGKHISKDASNEIKYKHIEMFIFNKWVIQNFKISNILNKEHINNSLMNYIKDSPIGNINDIINTRIKFLQKHKYNEDYIVKENLVLGVICKIENPIIDGYYIEKVKLRWPTRGANSSLECWIKVNCESDLLFLEYNRNYNDIVVKTVNKFGNNFINKCYWTDSNTVHQLKDRVTKTSTTYNKRDSDSGWKKTWDL